MPIRQCVSCRNKDEKVNFIRLVRENGKVYIDKSSKQNGRGSYVCNNENCIEQAIKKSLFNRHLKMKIDDAIVQELRNYL